MGWGYFDPCNGEGSERGGGGVMWIQWKVGLGNALCGMEYVL